MLGLSITSGISTPRVTGTLSIQDMAAIKMYGLVAELRLLEEDRNKIRIGLKLRLNIVNEGNKSAILLKQDFAIGAEMLARSFEEANAQKYLYKSTHWPSVSRAPRWTSWKQHLDTATPQQSLTIMLLPNESLPLEAETSLYIEKAGNFDGTDKPWDEIRHLSTIWLQVQVRTWPINLEPTRNSEKLEFGEELQQRWQSFGDLQLKHITSEPIPMDFSTLTMSNTASKKQ